ncbi:MAG: hypothetical protein JJE37_01395 [Methyloceanibacter sp.]|jgi:hypothetical protein|nr:hypothetical protein [Methyloceanibacter sp.]
MTTEPKLRVQVVDDKLIVTLPGSHYSVTYYKPGSASHLMAKNIAERDDLRIQLPVADFLAAAWRLANDKARELGWIV